MKPLHMKILLILGVVAFALFYAWPREERPVLNMSLGLDLKGGSHLMMEVVTDDAVKAEADLAATRVGDRLRREGFAGARAVVGETIGTVEIEGIPADRVSEARTLAADEYSSWPIDSLQGGLRMRMPDLRMTEVRDRAVRQALTTITNRVDEFGVAEPSITRVGGGNNDRILVQLPGVEDPSRVKRVLQTQAQLSFRLLHYGPGDVTYEALTEEDVIAAMGGQIPPGVIVLPAMGKDPQTGLEVISNYVAVEKSAALTGTDLADAQASNTQFGEPNVSFQVRVSAADRFGRFTGNNVNRRMAIVLDDRVKSSPNIQERLGITSQITGSFTPQETEDLALTLRSGALPARVRPIEERTVGPSLGFDSIKSGYLATGLGFVLVMIFMVFYYRLSGVNAVVALVLNLILVAAVMAAMGATLTLPGIGGFILTVGMAVDANVLIFERIREELRAGKTVRGAIQGGFGKALSAILDANITTMIAAFFLFNYGTGPVRGFAFTLFIGILASMFTAIFVSRTIFELILGDRAVKKLSI